MQIFPSHLPHDMFPLLKECEPSPLELRQCDLIFSETERSDAPQSALCEAPSGNRHGSSYQTFLVGRLQRHKAEAEGLRCAINYIGAFTEGPTL